MLLLMDSIITFLLVIIMQVSILKCQDDILNAGEVYIVAENNESFQNTTNCTYFTVDRVKSEVKCGANCWKLGECAAFQFSDTNTQCILCVEDVAQVPNTPGLIEFDGSFYKDDKIWKAKCKPMNFGPFGGKGGGAFSDIDSYINGGKVTAIHVCYDNNVWKPYGIWMTYGNTEGKKYGKTSGTCEHFVMNSKEFVTGVNGTISVHSNGALGIVSQITFFTNEDRTFGPIGVTETATFSYTSDQPLGYISGRSGSAIDNLNFHVICEND